MRRHVGRGAPRLARLITGSLNGVLRWLLDGEVLGREHLPRHGPFIVTTNHLSLVDPILVSVAVGRLVRFLALDELFGRSRALDAMMLYFGAIPLSRDRPPLGALREAVDALERGEILGIFPEGARAEYWGERPVKNGAAWLSLATGAPIVPCSITGTETTLSLAEPRVRIPAARLVLHPIIDPDTYCDREDPLGVMMGDWAAAIDDDVDHWAKE